MFYKPITKVKTVTISSYKIAEILASPEDGNIRIIKVFLDMAGDSLYKGFKNKIETRSVS